MTARVSKRQAGSLVIIFEEGLIILDPAPVAL